MLQLLDDLKKTTGYWKLKQEATDRTRWRTLLARGYARVVRQTTELMKMEIYYRDSKTAMSPTNTVT